MNKLNEASNSSNDNNTKMYINDKIKDKDNKKILIINQMIIIKTKEIMNQKKVKQKKNDNYNENNRDYNNYIMGKNYNNNDYHKKKQ